MLSKKEVARLSEEAQQHLIKLIQFDTTNPPGNETPAAEYIRDVLKKNGIESELIESAPGRGNLVSRIKGDGSKKPLCLASHLDVVPASREEWTVDPFAGVIKDGCIWGRGAVDMKFVTAMHLVIFIDLARRGAPLKRDLILLTVADEEESSMFGMDFMVKNHFGKIDCEYSLNEGGGYQVNMDGKTMYNVQVAEKGANRYKIVTRGRPGHGSVPRPDNAMVKMSHAIIALSKPLPPRRNKIVETTIALMASKMLSGVESVAFRQLYNPLLSNFVLGQMRAKNEDIANMISSLLRDTVSATIINGGNKDNVIPDKVEAVLDCRLLPGQTKDTFMELMHSIADVDEIIPIPDAMPVPNESSIESELYETIRRVTAKHDENGVLIPLLSSGVTDSRFLRAKGITAYGYNPYRSSKVPVDEYLSTAHAHDERLPIDDFDFGMSCLYDIVAETVL